MVGHSCKNQPNQAISFVGSGYSGEMWILMAQIFGRNFIKKNETIHEIVYIATAVHIVRQNTAHANEICL